MYVNGHPDYVSTIFEYRCVLPCTTRVIVATGAEFKVIVVVVTF